MAAANNRYRRVVITKHGDPSVLQIVESTLPPLAPDHIQVQVEAAGVANPDVLMRVGVYPGAPKPPFTPGYDITGEVIAVGSAVTDIPVGQTIVGWLRNGIGGYSDIVQLPAAHVAPAPAALDAAERVSIVVNYMTAYQLLHRMARVTAGERVLIHGASGGVGTALLQLGKLAGVEMYGTASKHNHDLLEQYGATPINYRSEDFVARIRDLTASGVDAVFDPIGGQHYRRSLAALRPGGRLVAYGFQTAISGGKRDALGFLVGWLRQPRKTPLSLFDTSTAIMGYGFNNRPDWHRPDITHLLELLEQRQIAPIIADRLPLAEVSRAHTLLGEGGVRGKLILLPR